jgi:outer membrane protein OmpA-like peptidoglycan-associated protein
MKRTRSGACPALVAYAAASLGAASACGGGAADGPPASIAAVDASVTPRALQPSTPQPPTPQPAAPAGDPRRIDISGLPLDGAEIAGVPDIEFVVGQTAINLTPQNEMVLNMLRRVLTTYPIITRLRVEGHTDDTGSEGDRARLTLDRASAVLGWLVAHGIEPLRLHGVGCGSRNPLFPNDTPEHRARNRRLELHIEEFDGKGVEVATAACTPNPFRHLR